MENDRTQSVISAIDNTLEDALSISSATAHDMLRGIARSERDGSAMNVEVQITYETLSQDGTKAQ